MPLDRHFRFVYGTKLHGMGKSIKRVGHPKSFQISGTVFVQTCRGESLKVNISKNKKRDQCWRSDRLVLFHSSKFYTIPLFIKLATRPNKKVSKDIRSNALEQLHKIVMHESKKNHALVRI